MNRSLLAGLILLAATSFVFAQTANEVYQKGNEAFQQKKYVEAAQFYTECIRLEPTYTNCYFNRGLARYIAIGFGPAIEDFTQVIVREPKNPKGYRNRGKAYHDLKKFEDAFADFSNAIHLEAKNAENYYLRGRTYESLGNSVQAIVDFTSAIANDPKFAKAYAARAAIYKNQKNFDLALKDYSSAIANDPNDAGSLFDRGMIYFDQNKADVAEADFNRAITLNKSYRILVDGKKREKQTAAKLGADKQTPSVPATEAEKEKRGNQLFESARRNYADVKFEAVVADYNEYLKLFPNEKNAIFNRAVAYNKMGQITKAISDFRLSISSEKRYHLATALAREELAKLGETGEKYYQRGLEALKNRNYDVALSAFIEAIELDPRHAKAHFERGRLYRNFGMSDPPKLDMAKADFTKALEVDPGFTAAKEALEELKKFVPAITPTAKPTPTNPTSPAAPVYQPKTVQNTTPVLTDAEKKKKAEDLYSNAVFNFRGKQYELAVVNFTEYLRIYPNSAEVYFNRGITYRDWGKTDKAIADLEQALKLKPDLTLAKTELAKLNTAARDEIITSISQISDVKPSDEFYDALRSLVEKYGISKVTTGRKFNPNRALTMDEYADFIKQAKATLKDLASGFGTKTIDEKQLFGPNCTLPYLSTIPEKEFGKSLSCHFRLRNFSIQGGETPITRGKFAIFLLKALEQALPQ